MGNENKLERGNTNAFAALMSTGYSIFAIVAALMCAICCFPAEAQMLLDTDKIIQMKDLRVGHRILTGKCNQIL